MKSFATILLLLVTCGMCFAQNIDSLVKQRVLLQETPGIVVGVFKDNKVKYYCYGVANTETKEPVTSKTIFEIGSITKTFTTLLLAQLVDSKAVSLQDPIQKFLPPGVSAPKKESQPITIENLATARSGLPRMPDNFSPADPQNPYIDYTPKQLYEFLDHFTFTRDIGSAYEYSNLGMGLLAHLLTLQAHKSYRQLLNDRITRPLQMNQTFINSPGVVSSKAVGYNGKEKVSAWTWTDESVLQGAGGIISNAEDMLKYVVTNLNEPTTPLGKAMALTHQARFDAGKSDQQIGLAWHIMNSKIIWHDGGTGGFRSFAGFNPSNKTAVIVLTNSTTGASDLGLHILDNSLELKKIVVPITVDRKIMEQYVGDYELTPQFIIHISLKGDALFCQATGQSALEMFPESEKKFFLKVVNAQFEFVKNASGKVEKLQLYQGGAVQAAVKK